MSAEGDIRYWNRERGRIETEAVYGEAFLRWAYGSPLGRFAVRVLVQRPVFSAWYGWRMDRPASARQIRPFVERYGVDPAEFARDIDDFTSFNDFFSRALKPEARPVDPAAGAVVFPADGRHLAIPDVGKATRFYAKGQHFDLAGLVGDRDLAAGYAGGSLLISRLCPTDYHRFHFPLAGVPGAARPLPGSLRSVSPLALRRNLSILWENRRYLTRVAGSPAGDYLMLEIGATCVGRVHQTATAGTAVAKGAEKGYFAFGGSCVATVFKPGAVCFDDDLVERGAGGIEVYAKMGERCGTVKGA